MGLINTIKTRGIVFIEAESDNYKKLEAVDDSAYHSSIKKV